MTSQRRSSDHSHTGNQVGCEHRICEQDGPHSLHQHPNEADKADDGKASGNEGFHLDCPPIGMRTVFPRKLRVLDLFSGIGGFSLGLERATLPGAKINGFETVAFCEIEEFPRRVLAKHWPNVPCYDDVRTLTAERLAADGIAVDVICGGFPCQDISVAGEGLGLAGERSGLFFEVVRLIGELEPQAVILENVGALLCRGLDAVLGALASLGYDAEWHCIPAAYVGFPHIRDRVWIIAHPREERAEGRGEDAVPWLTGVSWGENVGRAEAWAKRPDISESGLCRSYNGIPNGVDRVGSCGNAVVPHIPELIGNAILQSLNDTGSKGTDGLGFAVSDFPFCHAGENDHD